MLGTSVNVIVSIPRQSELDGSSRPKQDKPAKRTTWIYGEGGGLFTLHQDFAKPAIGL